LHATAADLPFHMPNAYAYTVLAECESDSIARDFIDWLTRGHVQAVLDGGASEVRVVARPDDGFPQQVEVRYLFESKSTYDRYVKTAAPRLREEGRARFPEGSGIEMSRTEGEQIFMATPENPEGDQD